MDTTRNTKLREPITRSSRVRINGSPIVRKSPNRERVRVGRQNWRENERVNRRHRENYQNKQRDHWKWRSSNQRRVCKYTNKPEDENRGLGRAKLREIDVTLKRLTNLIERLMHGGSNL